MFESCRVHHLFMATTTLVSEAEYLSTLYRPDCDYIEGELRERNLGQQDHSNLQSEVLFWFRLRAAQLGLKAFVEQRIRVGLNRYRIPDVCVVQVPVPREQVFTFPPHIVIEILSPEDTFSRLQERFDDYLAMGVQNIWVLNPESERGWIITKQGHLEAFDKILRTADGLILLPIADLTSV